MGIATDPTGTGDPDILLMGDLNSYAMEDPVALIKGYADAPRQPITILSVRRAEAK